jgi:hypothetical protein
MKAIRRELRLLRTDFWASSHSGAVLILAFGILWLVVMLVVL